MWFALACVLHLIAGFFYMLSGLSAPVWVVMILFGIWIALAVRLSRMRTEGLKTLIIPLVAGVIWYVVLWAGDLLLDWTPAWTPTERSVD